eukprot:576572-Amphidinium_carterae.1
MPPPPPQRFLQSESDNPPPLPKQSNQSRSTRAILDVLGINLLSIAIDILLGTFMNQCFTWTKEERQQKEVDLRDLEKGLSEAK